MKKLLLLIAGCFLTFAAIAQETQDAPEMSTDRPSAGDAARIVLPGYVQIETGLMLERDATNDLIFKDYQLPDVLVRIGLLKFAELRVRGQVTRVSFNARNADPFFKRTGLDDIMIGTKVQLLQNEGARPAAALQADFRLPVGGEFFKGDKIEPKLRMAFRNKLTDDLSLSYNIGVEWEENLNPFDKQEYNHIGLYTLALSYKFTDNFSGYVEAFAEKHKKDVRQSLDAGIAYKLMPNLQLDLYSGVGLSEEAPDFFVSTGVSFRLPN